MISNKNSDSNKKELKNQNKIKSRDVKTQLLLFAYPNGKYREREQPTELIRYNLFIGSVLSSIVFLCLCVCVFSYHQTPYLNMFTLFIYCYDKYYF